MFFSQFHSKTMILNLFRRMELLSILRMAFQVMALGIFMFQMQESVRQLIRNPVVTEDSMTTLDQISKPIIMIAQEGQFNYTKTKKYGYEYQISFLAGNVEGLPNIARWTGGFKAHIYLRERKSSFISQARLFNVSVYLTVIW